MVILGIIAAFTGSAALAVSIATMIFFVNHAESIDQEMSMLRKTFFKNGRRNRHA